MNRRYTVECETLLATKYHGHVDFKACNQVSKKLYREMLDTFKQPDGYIDLDTLLITAAMFVHRLGHTIDHDVENTNGWANDAFPEFCSLVGPDNGFFERPTPATGANPE